MSAEGGQQRGVNARLFFFVVGSDLSALTDDEHVY
jgi:hypothetical protein